MFRAYFSGLGPKQQMIFPFPSCPSMFPVTGTTTPRTRPHLPQGVSQNWTRCHWRLELWEHNGARDGRQKGKSPGGKRQFEGFSGGLKSGMGMESWGHCSGCSGSSGSHSRWMWLWARIRAVPAAPRPLWSPAVTVPCGAVESLPVTRGDLLTVATTPNGLGLR